MRMGNKVAIVGNIDNVPIRIVGRNHVQYNCAEGLGRLWGADIFEGRKWSKAEIEVFKTYDTIIVNGNNELWQLAIDLRNEGKQVGMLHEGSACFITSIDLDTRDKYVEAALAVSWYGALQQSSIPFLEENLGRKVIYTPLPCEPEHWYISNGALNYKERRIITHIEHGRELEYNLTILNNLGYDIVAYFITEQDKIFASKYNVKIEFRNIIPFSIHAKELSHYRVGIRMDNRYTDGRFPKVCAGMKVPCIGTPRTEAQKVLFPLLTFDPITGVEQAKEAIRRLFDDEEFYKATLQYSFVALRDNYSPEVVKRIVEKQLEKI